MASTPEKRQTAEEVQWENRIAYQKGEHDRLLKAKESLQAEIDRKSSDYAIHMAQVDSTSKKLRQDTLDGNNQLSRDKADFQEVLKEFQKQKQEFIDSQKETDSLKVQNEAKMNNIKEFIIAVQRACSLLGL